MASGASHAALAAASGTWTLTGSLPPGREAHTATLLASGSVVAAGGETATTVTTSTKIFNPATGKWVPTGPLATARAAHSAVLLSGTKILAAGGCTGTCAGANSNTAEIYNSGTGKWSATGSMGVARDLFGMVMLKTGKVLAAGGCTGQNANGCSGVTLTAELYDPSTGKWTPTGSLHAARGSATMTLLASGKVLVAGGTNAAGNPIRSAEVYDPAKGTWAFTGAMMQARDEHTATLLGNGKVLVTGGENLAGISAPTAELYDPTAGSWSLTGNLHIGRLEHTAVLLGNGSVLVSGGRRVTMTATTVLNSAEIYNTAAGTWATTGNMIARRADHTSTVLQSGLVLDAAGASPVAELASAELYQP